MARNGRGLWKITTAKKDTSSERLRSELSNVSVLVVDDEPGMRNFLPKALKKPLRHGRLRIKAPDLTIMHERDLPAAKRVAIVAAGGRSG